MQKIYCASEKLFKRKQPIVFLFEAAGTFRREDEFTLQLKKVVLITTGQPAINPRLVKEAGSLSAAGYDVTVLYCHYIEWATKVEKTFLYNVSWKYRMVGGCPAKNKTLYTLTRIRFKLARLLNAYVHFSVFAEKAQTRAFNELLDAAKEIKADLYIGHNLGALPVAVLASKYHGSRAAFDFEDYHRGEYKFDDWNRKRIAWLENKYLPALSYYSCSSPLIAEAVKKDHGSFGGKNIVLLNCFPLVQQPLLRQESGSAFRLKLFWFSQTIGENRGLETVMEALNLLNDPEIELTLAGRCDPLMKKYIEQQSVAMASPVHFAGIITPDELPAFASRFDVGIATEKNEPENRNLCLTNKIFTYLLAGNAILASDTTAQEIFFGELKEVALIFKQNNPLCLAEKIKRYKHDLTLLSQHRKNAYMAAKEHFHWEKQAETLIKQCQSLERQNVSASL